LSLTNRLPKLREAIAVYAVSVVILYTFSLWFSIQDFSKNWILHLGAMDILGIFSYIIVGAFIESFLVISVLMFIYFLFSPSISQGRFTSYGTIFTITFLLALILRDNSYVGIGHILANNNSIFTFFIVSSMTLLLLSERLRIVRLTIEAFADRCTVFLYFYLPLSLSAIIVVVIRNIG
jgi:hypothetical protein